MNNEISQKNYQKTYTNDNFANTRKAGIRSQNSIQLLPAFSSLSSQDEFSTISKNTQNQFANKIFDEVSVPDKISYKTKEELFTLVQISIETLKQKIAKHDIHGETLKNLPKILNDFFTNLKTIGPNDVEAKMLSVVDNHIMGKMLNARQDLMNQPNLKTNGSINEKYTHLVRMFKSIFSTFLKGIYGDNRGYMLDISKLLIEAEDNNQLSVELIKNIAQRMHTGIKNQALPFNVNNIVKILEKLTDEKIFLALKKNLHSLRTDTRRELRFIYTYYILTALYQLDGEGSCFASAILKVFQENMPQAWINFVFKIITENIADFSHFLGHNKSDNNLCVDVSSIEFDKNLVEQIYQKMVHAVAFFYPRRDAERGTKPKIGIDQRDIKSKIGTNIHSTSLFMTNSPFGKMSFNQKMYLIRKIQDTLSQSIVFIHGKWLPISFASNSIQILQNTIKPCIMEVDVTGNPKDEENMAQSTAKMLMDAEANSKIGIVGGKISTIINTLASNDNDKLVVERIYPCGQENLKPSAISIETMNKILETLSGLPKNQSIIVTYENRVTGKIATGGHAMTFRTKPYPKIDKDGAKTEEIFEIGDLNYLRDSSIFCRRRTNENFVQLVRKNYKDKFEPISKQPFQKLSLYPNFGINNQQ